MLYGLGAALGWGLSDITVAVVSRRIGSFFSVVIAQLAGLILFAVLLVVARPPMPVPGALRLTVLLAAGISGALSYMAFYRGLELGPIALVSPVVAGYAAIVVVLALVVLHERVAGVALAGTGLTLAGAVLASTDIAALRARVRRERGGVFYALLAMVGFGLGAFVIGRVSKDVGWFEAVLVTRLRGAGPLGIVPGSPQEPNLLGSGSRKLVSVAVAGGRGILGIASFGHG